MRQDLLENTKSILALLEKRREITRKIGKIKHNNGLPIRDAERELRVKSELCSNNPLLNVLFEASIFDQQSLNSAMDLRLSGDKDSLLFALGLILSKPGIIICVNRAVPRSLEAGCQLNGGHIVVGGNVTPDAVIDLKTGELAKLEGESLFISAAFIESRHRLNSVRLLL
ncbi:chorismate mutase [Thermoplasma volcanium]|uniref:chorismate mutase n=1 Tax=Thermoplasma volcanium TaxID=50339 RepID=UPI0013899159|nr:chorismate mutase [Thermoplasma volcanium]